MKTKGIIAAIIISPFYIAFILLGLIIALLFAGLLRLAVWIGIIDGLLVCFELTNRVLKRYNLRKITSR